MTTHPTPGGYFSDPYVGTYLQRNAAGQVFTSIPDEDDPDSEPNRITFVGTADTPELLLLKITEFITSEDHEVASAIHFHFQEKSFGAEDWFWQAMPEFYWFRLGQHFGSLAPALEQALKTESPLYEYVARFFDSPDAPEFTIFREEVSHVGSFEGAFLRFKYVQGR